MLVLVVNGGIQAENKDSQIFSFAKTLNILIKSTIHNEEPYNDLLVQQVWPERAVFIDWLNPNTSIFWKFGLSQMGNIDGIWLD